MKNVSVKSRISPIIFYLAFLVLAVFASRTFLFYDDVMYGFPAVTKKYFDFYGYYIRDWGLFRPLALVYYFFIYELFIRIPALAHLIPLAILVFSSFLLFKILLRQGLSKNTSLILGLLLATSPFAVESFSWLSANISLIVILIFFIQIYLIESNRFQSYRLEAMLLLQLAAVFFYESTMFLTIPLAYLLYAKNKEKSKLILASFVGIPVFIYLVSKIAIRPFFEHKDKVLTLYELISNWTTSIHHLRVLFSLRYLKNFWWQELVNGYNVLNNYVIAFIFFSFFIYLLASKLFEKRNHTPLIFRKYNRQLKFWGVSFLFSLIPLSWQPTYQPFRTLLLPFVLLVVALFFIIYERINNDSGVPRLNVGVPRMTNVLTLALKITSLFIISVFIMIQTSMIDKYFKQYNFDKKIALEIDKKLDELGFNHPVRSNLYLKNLPYNNFTQPRYGDYIYNMYHYYWSAEALLDLNSGGFKNVAIEVPSDNYFTARNMTKEEFLELRPLTIMSYTDNESCDRSECLRIELVIN